ncbi:unnamed protein product [Blepharisma stoltei]|uniref:E2F/DP family winged-helix DNA-binding domain-containing protein n=1 Tax=Blepharisma stoltei TaxID=1481888 RepID=A0AAU9IE14_9CILI|nr:unnamed protein product [Blepharisma stoltei]
MASCPPLDLPVPDKNKKLINLSKQVLEKVKNSEVTTGNQIAKAILKDFPESTYEAEFKNIQRRVYDALNVLQAIDVISKIRNEIRYKGIINNEQLERMKLSVEQNRKRNMQKKKALAENIFQYIAIHKLMQRNKEQRKKKLVELPCLIVGGGDANIDIQEDSVRLTSPIGFTIANDTHLLSRLDLHCFRSEELPENFPDELINLIGSNDFVKTEDLRIRERDYRQMLLQLTENQ